MVAGSLVQSLLQIPSLTHPKELKICPGCVNPGSQVHCTLYTDYSSISGQGIFP